MAYAVEQDLPIDVACARLISVARFIAQSYDPNSGQESVVNRDGGALSYQAYLPDVLLGRAFKLDKALAQKVAAAEHEIAAFEHDFAARADSLELAERLVRAEALASSNMDGLAVSEKRLNDAQGARARGRPTLDTTAHKVLANMDALRQIASDRATDVNVSRICAFHGDLVAPAGSRHQLSAIRTTPKWIGGAPNAPLSAAFVPPPAAELPALLHDLCNFCNDDLLPPVAQAAIAHAQFETIHPFVDGNGRTGRGLVHMVLKRRGLIDRTLPPLSMVLDARLSDYEGALQATRYAGQPDSADAIASVSNLIELFAAAFVGAVAEAQYV